MQLVVFFTKATLDPQWQIVPGSRERFALVAWDVAPAVTTIVPAFTSQHRKGLAYTALTPIHQPFSAFGPK